ARRSGSARVRRSLAGQRCGRSDARNSRNFADAPTPARKLRWPRRLRVPWHGRCCFDRVLGLVMTAGGARGAYQAGVMRRIAEIPSLHNAPSPFAIITGASAGAINGTALAARAADFGDAGVDVARLWCELTVEKVFRSDIPSLVTTGALLARDFLLGSILGHTVTHGIFDTSPLEAMMEAAFPPHGIADAIRRGQLYAVAVTATSYHSGRSYTFVQ